MVRRLEIKKYRKLIDFNVSFDKNINLISGGNGTCKSSLLYLVSNSYKKLTQSSQTPAMSNCLKTIYQLNNKFNPKIENLTKGDKIHNDPANGISGSILTSIYFNDLSLNFRKHVSGKNNENYRYSIKPNYSSSADTKESLPEMPIIYLGLSRLLAFGEIDDLSSMEIPEEITKSLSTEQNEILNDFLTKNISSPLFKTITKKLPDQYIETINDLYSSFTRINISKTDKFTSIGKQKIRPNFITNEQGIDSNTISAGEDNLYIIITALVSLKYYYDNLESSEQEVESILLIDEIDATLHPYYQDKLLKLLIDYSEKYKIQVLATTHSIDLLEVALEQKQNVLYLIDNVQNVDILNPDGNGNLEITQIRNFLKQQRNEDLGSKKIAVFTEDNEARLILNLTLDHIKSLNRETNLFERAISYLHFVDMNAGSDNLKNLFSDSYLVNNLVNAICILDGDQSNEWTKKIITLPGNNSPEKLLLDYLDLVIHNIKYNDFWRQPAILQQSYQKVYVIENIQNVYKKIESDIITLKQNDKSAKGIRRSKFKELFNEHIFFFTELYKYWLNDPDNKQELDEFIKDFSTMFNKTRQLAGIPYSLVLPTYIKEKEAMKL